MRLSEDAAAELGERLEAARNESEVCHRPCCSALDPRPGVPAARKPYVFVFNGTQWPIHRFVAAAGQCGRCRQDEDHDVHGEVGS